MRKILTDLLRGNPSLKNSTIGIPSLGSRSDKKIFSKEILNIYKSIYYVSRETKKMDVDINLKKYSFSSGDSLRCVPFKPCIIEMKKTLKRKDLYSYTSAFGYNEHKEKIIKYLAKEKFTNTEPHKDSKIMINGLSLDNIAFTISTTHGYNLVLDTILKPYDVVIVPCPNYSFFDFVPERMSSNCVLFELSQEDDWIVDYDKLRKKIDEINKKLKNKYNKLPYVPRVKAFLNCNPSNPLGKSMGSKHLGLLNNLLDLAKEKNFFIIDDLVYQDICFENSLKPIPLATIGKNFSNVISLMGLSKAYGLASIRAGIVVADEIIIREITNKIFQTIDSYPIIQSAALAGAFNDSNKRYKYYKKYFKKINLEYKYRYNIVLSLVNGIDSVCDDKQRKKIIRYFKKNVNRDMSILNTGIKNISLVKNSSPDAGFFTLLDFTALKGKKYNNIIINSDKDLLKFFYVNKNVKFLVGSSIGYPEKDKLIARITFALEPDILIESFYAMNDAINLLED